MKAKTRKVKKVARPTKRAATKKAASPQDQIIELASQAGQLAALRKYVSDKEAEVKAEIENLMRKHKLTEVVDTVDLNGNTVELKVKKTVTAVTSINMEKLLAKLTDEQFKEIATVSQKAAKDALPTALVNECIDTHDPRTSYSVKAGKGIPVPEVKLFE